MMAQNNRTQNEPERRLVNPAAVHIEAAKAIIDAIKDLDPSLATRVIAIMAGAPADRPLTVDKAFAAASYEAKTGAVVGRDFYVDSKLGNIPSVRGIEREVSSVSGDYQVSFRPPRNEELEQVDPPLMPGDMLYVCEITQLAVYKQVLQIQALEKQVSGKISTVYLPIVGIGVLREKERFTGTRKWDDFTNSYQAVPKDKWVPLDLSPNFSWDKKVRIRAKRDALKKIPGFGATVREVIEEAESEGIDMDLPNDGHVSIEQAHELARQRRQEAARRAENENLSIEEQRRQMEERRREMFERRHREDLEDMAFQWHIDRGPCPMCGAPEKTNQEERQAHTADCELRQLLGDPESAPIWIDPDAGKVRTNLRQPQQANTTDEPAKSSDQLFEEMPSASAERKEAASKQPTTSASDGPAHSRPFSGETIKSMMATIVTWAEQFPEKATVNGTYGAALSILDKLLKGHGGHRAVIEALWNVKSATELSAARKYALTRWVSPEKDKGGSEEWIPQHYIRAECANLLGKDLPQEG